MSATHLIYESNALQKMHQGKLSNWELTGEKSGETKDKDPISETRELDFSVA